MDNGDLQQSIDQLTRKVDQLIKRWSPWRHLLNGVMSGIGAAAGATLVLAIIVWALNGLARVDILKPAVDSVLPYLNQSQKNPLNYADEAVSSPSPALSSTPSPSPSPSSSLSPAPFSSPESEEAF